MLSFSLDFAGIFSQTNMIVNGLFPVYLIPLGISLGLGLIAIIAKAFDSLVNHTWH